MSTAKQLMHEGYGYFEELKESTQEIVKDAILKIAQERRGPDCWKSDDDALESVECKGRSGFIPHSWNKGGFQYNNFTDLMGYWGGGYTTKHSGAASEIERQIEYTLEMIRKDIFEQFKADLVAMGLNESDCNYHTISDLAENSPNNELLAKVLREIENKE